MTETTCPHREDIGCDVAELHYSFVERAGSLTMAEGHCCDMSGCIALFKKIDPAVQYIQTFAGLTPDTEYRLIRGQWCAKGHQPSWRRHASRTAT